MAEASAAPTRDVVVIGASSGGIGALRQLASRMSPDYRGAVAVVQHISAEAPSALATILARAGPLPAVEAEDLMPLEFGRIHVAKSDCHLLIETDHLRVVHGPRENRHRPAIDPLFRSAAWSYGPRVVGVVLTGNLDDGTAGLWAIKSCGGTTVVQEPADAMHPEMPANALMHNRVDHRAALDAIPALLNRLSREPVHGVQITASELPAVASEVEFAKLGGDVNDVARLGALSPFTCPACRGALWEIEEGGHLRYRCHTGHAYSQASLSLEQDLSMESSVFTALRAVEEKAMTLRRMAARWPEHLPRMRHEYEERARELDRSADVLRGMLAGEPRVRTMP